MHWKKPKDDGDLPLTGYIVEKMDPTTGVWVPVSFLDPSKTDHEVTGLEPNKKYHFRVKAVNEEGESPPLETDTAILAKNPYGKYFFSNDKVYYIQRIRNLMVCLVLNRYSRSSWITRDCRLRRTHGRTQMGTSN